MGDLLTDFVLPPLAAELDQYVFQDTQLEGFSKDLFSKSGDAIVALPQFLPDLKKCLAASATHCRDPTGGSGI